MKKINLISLFIVFLFVSCFEYDTYAQSRISSSLGSLSGEVDFSISLSPPTLANPTSSFLAFCEFDDGHFLSTGSSSFNHFYHTSGSKNVIARIVDRYEEDDIDFLHTCNPNPTTTSLVPIRQVNTNGRNIKITRAFDNSDNSKNIYVITITNISAPSSIRPNGVDGSLTVNFPNIFTITGIRQAGVVNTPNSATSFTTNFQNLQFNEQRNIFVDVDIQTNQPSYSPIPVTVSATIKFDETEETAQDDSRLTRTPHDPNFIHSSEKCLDIWEVPKQLKYFVHFQNDGKGTANNVVLQIPIWGDVDMGSIAKEDSSDPCTWSVNGSTLEVRFDNINLPGFKDPILKPAYTETTGFFEFSVSTLPSSNHGHIIKAFADIFFDAQDPIRTNLASTHLYDDCSVHYVPKDNDLFIPYDDFDFETFYGENDDWSIYPNPTSSEINIQGEFPEGTQFIVQDLTGASILSYQTTTFMSKVNIKIDDIKSGVYILRLINKGGNQSKKFIKL